MSHYSRDDNNFADDDAIEITNLPLDGATQGQEQPDERQRISLRARRDRKQTLVRNSIVGSIAGCALIIFLMMLLTDTPWQHAFSIFLPPTATPSSTSTDNLFYFQNLPSWGTVTLNGQPLSHIPTVQEYPPLQLATGQYKLVWQASPFLPYRCTLLVPPGPPPPSVGKNSCLVGTTMSQFGNRAINAIFIPISLTQLPGQQRTELIMATQALLNTQQETAIIPTGDYYLGPHGAQRATFPFQATQHYILDVDSNQPPTCTGFGPTKSCSIGIQDCRLFCTLQQIPSRTSAIWRVAAIFHSKWNYTPLPGSHNKPPISSAEQDEQFVMLQIHWLQNGWQVSFIKNINNFDNIKCVTSEQELASPNAPQYEPISIAQVALNYAFVSTPGNNIDCLTAIWIGSDSLTGATNSPSAWLIERFGVLESGNNEAHHIWPHLPVATPPIQRVAAQVARNAKL